jgi:hypothetical protein
VASGPAVVLVCTALFVLAFLFSPSRGIVWSWRAFRPQKVMERAG